MSEVGSEITFGCKRDLSDFDQEIDGEGESRGSRAWEVLLGVNAALIDTSLYRGSGTGGGDIQ